jgi:hypothetical protein
MLEQIVPVESEKIEEERKEMKHLLKVARSRKSMITSVRRLDDERLIVVTRDPISVEQHTSSNQTKQQRIQ